MNYLKSFVNITILILFFLFGMTWDLRYEPSYYERRGWLIVSQKVLNVSVLYRWSSPGLRDKYPDEWDIGKMEKFYYLYPRNPMDQALIDSLLSLSKEETERHEKELAEKDARHEATGF